jgi:hypothetical protein
VSVRLPITVLILLVDSLWLWWIGSVVEDLDIVWLLVVVSISYEGSQSGPGRVRSDNHSRYS